MAVWTLGLNHTTAPLDLRGRFAFAVDQLAPTLHRLRQDLAVKTDEEPEAAILSTCNRTEIYCAASHASPHDTLHWLARTGGVSPQELQSHTYLLEGDEAARVRDSALVVTTTKTRESGLRPLDGCGASFERLFDEAHLGSPCVGRRALVTGDTLAAVMFFGGRFAYALKKKAFLPESGVAPVKPGTTVAAGMFDEDLAKRVADGLGIELPGRAAAAKAPVDLGTSDALSIQKQAKQTFKGRKIGILFDEGSDRQAITQLVSEIQTAGGTAFLVAPKIGPLKLKGGELKANGQLAGSPSVLFDAVVAMLLPERAEKLARDVGAVAWFADAWYHCKTIGACAGTREHLLPKANIEPDDGVIAPEKFMEVGPVRHWEREPKVRDLA